MQDLESCKKEKLTIDLAWANVFAILILLPIALIFGLPYYLLWGSETDVKNFINNIRPLMTSLKMLLFFAIWILGIIAHELIHGITWAQFAKNGFKSIKFGVLWKMLTPYCHCKEPLKVKHYILGALTPAIILGFIPSNVAIIIGNLGMLIFGMGFTMVAAGDYLIINLV